MMLAPFVPRSHDSAATTQFLTDVLAHLEAARTGKPSPPNDRKAALKATKGRLQEVSVQTGPQMALPCKRCGTTRQTSWRVLKRQAEHALGQSRATVFV
jgi:hypothetical protein